MNTSSSSSLATAEISDYNAEIGMLGEEEHMFFMQGGLEDVSTPYESTEWDLFCQVWEREEAAKREAFGKMSIDEMNADVDRMF
jgi:hypothetical protein